MLYRVPLLFSPQPEGGLTVTSPALPELVTEGDTLAEAFADGRDALAAVVELYADEGRALPSGVTLPAGGEVISVGRGDGSRHAFPGWCNPTRPVFGDASGESRWRRKSSVCWARPPSS